MLHNVENQMPVLEMDGISYGGEIIINNIFNKRRGDMVLGAIKDGIWTVSNCQEYISHIQKLSIATAKKHFNSQAELNEDQFVSNRQIDGMIRKGINGILKSANSSSKKIEKQLFPIFLEIENLYRWRYEIVDNCGDDSKVSAAITTLYKTSLEASIWRALNSELKLGIPVKHFLEYKYIESFEKLPEYANGIFAFARACCDERSIRSFYMVVSSVVYTKALHALRSNPELLTQRVIKLIKYAIACECDLYSHGSVLIEIENECNKIQPNCIPTRKGHKAFTVLAELTKRTVLGEWLDTDYMSILDEDWDGLLTTMSLAKLFNTIQSKEIEKLGLIIRDESISARPLTIIFEEAKSRLVEEDAEISEDAEAIIDILISVIKNEINDELLEQSKELFERNKNLSEYNRLLSISEIVKSGYERGIEAATIGSQGNIVSYILDSVYDYCDKDGETEAEEHRDKIQKSMLEAVEQMDLEKVSILANQAKEIDHRLVSRGTALISDLINESLLEAYVFGHQVLETEKQKLEMVEAYEQNTRSIVKNNDALEDTILDAELKIEELEKSNATLRHRIEELSVVDNKPQVNNEKSDAEIIKKIIDDNLNLEDALAFVAKLENVVVLPSAYQSASDSPYQNTKKALQTLMTLTGPYYEAVSGGETAYNAAKTHLGSVYRARESKTVQSNGKLRHEREFDVNGKKTLFIEHITLGGGRDPQACMQIHFKIIDDVLYIGHCGTHLTVSSSN